MTGKVGICVLASGGLDSAILISKALEEGYEVSPLYVACGLPWEELEKDSLKQFLKNSPHPLLKDLVIQNTPLKNLFPDLWAFDEAKIPDGKSPTGAIYIPGRNLHLLTQASLLAFENNLSEIWLGILNANPYPDGQTSFFKAFEVLYQEAYDQAISVKTPFAEMTKVQLLRSYPDFPYQWTVTCLSPQGGVHCGDCNKCEERRSAFVDAGMLDSTQYLKS